MRTTQCGCGVEALESRRMMDGTALPPPDNLVGNLGRGHSAVMVTIDNPDLIDDPSIRLLTPGGKIVALPAKALPGIIRASDDPNL